jgi:hypothetical protein
LHGSCCTSTFYPLRRRTHHVATHDPLSSYDREEQEGLRTEKSQQTPDGEAPQGENQPEPRRPQDPHPRLGQGGQHQALQAGEGRHPGAHRAPLPAAPQPRRQGGQPVQGRLLRLRPRGAEVLGHAGRADHDHRRRRRPPAAAPTPGQLRRRGRHGHQERRAAAAAPRGAPPTARFEHPRGGQQQSEQAGRAQGGGPPRPTQQARQELRRQLRPAPARALPPARQRPGGQPETPDRAGARPRSGLAGGLPRGRPTPRRREAPRLQQEQRQL